MSKRSGSIPEFVKLPQSYYDSLFSVQLDRCRAIVVESRQDQYDGIFVIAVECAPIPTSYD